MQPTCTVMSRERVPINNMFPYTKEWTVSVYNQPIESTKIVTVGAKT